MHNPNCPLCQAAACELYFVDKVRRYLRCSDCQLVFVPEQEWLSTAEEKSVYDLHENDPTDPAYRKFLSRLTDPLLQKLKPACQGLDFGCGPGPALPQMLAEQGHLVDLFDPYYQNNQKIFTRRYDFICATEVVEHLRTPASEFSTLFSLLKDGGWLAIMTKLVRNRQAFRNWHYIRDPTHICFYRRETFAYLARRHSARLSFAADDVILLQKIEQPDTQSAARL